MIIRSMTARFGKLDNDVLHLQDGLNIISAPNERGKSTWCAFIRAMLYGIDTAQRQKAGSVTEKAAANPWSGLAPQGSMDIEYEGQKITLRRSTTAANAPMKQFSAVYTGSARSYPLTGESCGETLLGISRQVFARSAFISQGAVKIDNSPELEKRISAIVSTGSEETSLTDADERLKAWLRERNAPRTGMNSKLTAALEDTEMRLRSIESAHREADKLREDIAALDSLRQTEDTAPLSEKLAAAEENELLCRRRLEEGPFGTRDSREVALEISRVKRESTELLEKSRRSYSHKKLIAPALLLIAAPALGYMGLMDKKAALIPAGLFLVLAALSFLNSAAIAKGRRGAASLRRSLLRGYNVDDEAGLDALEAEHCRLYDDWILAKDAVLALRRSLESRFARSSDPAAHLRERLAEIQGRLSVLGDREELLAKKEQLSRAIAENERQSRDIALARELLQQAGAELFSQFSPKLTERTRELFARLTGGRYDHVELSAELDINARIKGDTLPHGSESMSLGTRRMLYLCLRLAICELALPEDKNCPLILDDALCALDDRRCADFLELLLEISAHRQIILFTCHSREAQILRGRAHIQEVTLS